MPISFKDYLVEDGKAAYFTFGRMNPPTVGHEKLLDKLGKESGKNPYFVFLSQSQDAKKNPLSYTDKIKHVRKMFPRHARRIIVNKKVRTPFDAASYLYDQGFKTITMVVGSDRVREFKTLLDKYNGVKGNHGFFNFQTINIVSAGERDPDSDGVDGMSASKMRKHAADNNFAEFSQGLGGMNNKDAKKLYIDVRSGMGLKENTVFSRHVELEPVSETREKFVKGELFELGDQVIVKESDQVGFITHLGSNYVIVQLSEDTFKRMWLDAVEKVEETVSVPSSAEFIPAPTGAEFIPNPVRGGKKRYASLNASKNAGLQKAMKKRITSFSTRIK